MGTKNENDIDDDDFRDIESVLDDDEPNDTGDDAGDPGDDIEIVIDDGAEPEDGDTEASGGIEADAGKEGEAEPDDAVDEDESYSERVRKRIDRERRLKEQERDRAAAAEARAAELEKELHTFRSKGERDKLDGDLTAAKDKLRKAREDYNTDAEVEALTEINRITARKASLETDGPPPKRAEGGGEPSGGKDDATQLSPLAQKWLKDNAWMQDGRYAAQQGAAFAINQALLKEGKYQDTDPKFYAELDRRLARTVRIPRTKPTNLPPTGQGRDVDRPPPRRDGSSRRVELTRDDIAQMRVLGLDTTDKKVLREYAMNKVSERRGAR